MRRPHTPHNYDGTSKRPVVDQGRKVGFAPPNEDDVDYDDITVQEAMNKSVNSVFAQMGVDVGMDRVMKVAGDLGMNTEGDQAVPAQTLGSMGASPLEMAGVYATLDNHGKKVTPAVVKSVEHKDRTVEFPEPIGEQVISREAADTVTSVLTGVVDTYCQNPSGQPRARPVNVAGQDVRPTTTSRPGSADTRPSWSPRSACRRPEDHPQSRVQAGGVPHYRRQTRAPGEIWDATLRRHGRDLRVRPGDQAGQRGEAEHHADAEPVADPSRTRETPVARPRPTPRRRRPQDARRPIADASRRPKSPRNSPSSEPPTDGQSTEPENPLFPDGDRQER
ncbi:penicillin-binding transpeptidase domain-containing protein [Streptomyces sp. DHE17-7]|uniref:penicillin-binding transpeptidase domain-containing protein n=1 Tax=Streptomyces sp. DHE17-7 TaxID=2759949 RepID=UPI0022EB34BF|nr:penicillin-binding transpeptidase domain-containing protein [Streptomyces sp. DHE17-7]